MSPRFLVAATTAAAFALVPAAAAVGPAMRHLPRAHAARVPCQGGSNTFTIAHSAGARIFSYSVTGNDYGCLYSHGRPHYLSPDEHYAYRLVRFAGPYVAFVQNIRAGDDHIGVMDLRNGHVHNFPIASPFGNSVCPRANALVLKADGAIASIGRSFPPGLCSNPPGPLTEVRRHDHRGTKILDNHSTIALGSLHLTGSVIHWTDGGATRSASLE